MFNLFYLLLFLLKNCLMPDFQPDTKSARLYYSEPEKCLGRTEVDTRTRVRPTDRLACRSFSFQSRERIRDCTSACTWCRRRRSRFPSSCCCSASDRSSVSRPICREFLFGPKSRSDHQAALCDLGKKQNIKFWQQINQQTKIFWSVLISHYSRGVI